MNLNKPKIMGWLKYLVLAYIALGVMGGVVSAQTPSTQISQAQTQICNVVNGVREIAGFIALILFVIGGLLYAITHFFPVTGNFKAGAQGWAMGMIIGGLIGLVLVIIAPYIVGAIIGFGSTPATTGGTPISPLTC